MWPHWAEGFKCSIWDCYSNPGSGVLLLPFYRWKWALGRFRGLPGRYTQVWSQVSGCKASFPHSAARDIWADILRREIISVVRGTAGRLPRKSLRSQMALLLLLWLWNTDVRRPEQEVTRPSFLLSPCYMSRQIIRFQRLFFLVSFSPGSLNTARIWVPHFILW